MPLLTNVVRKRNGLLTATWILMTVSQVALVGLHPKFDGMLDVTAHQVVDAAFYNWHRAYLLITAVQWFAGWAHSALLVRPLELRRTNGGL